MNASTHVRERALPARFHEPRARRSLVEAQVRALLESSPAYHAVDDRVREQIEHDLVKISSYAAELVREELVQSLRLGQEPVVVERATMEGPGLPTRPPAAAPKRQVTARAQEGFEPSAANNIGRVTGETLRALSFPTFVADLIRGTFQAIVNATIQQMEAYGQLLANVSRTVDQFMADNITDLQARDWLAQRYPDHIVVRTERGTARAVVKDGADERPPPNFQLDLGVDASLDESSIEETLVPAARRKLAQSRHQMLATMVLMGMSRIVITGGKIRAQMAFHIDTSDALAQQRATDLDTRVAASGSFGFGPWSASLSASVAYVSSNRSQQTNEMNVSADLQSEVDLRFKSDYFPLERFVPPAGILQIQSATAVPSANPPSADALSPGALPDASPPPPPPRPRRPRPPPPEQRPLGALPPTPAPPTPPTPVAAPPPAPAPAPPPATPEAPAPPAPEAPAPPAPEAPAPPAPEAPPVVSPATWMRAYA